MSVPGPHSSRVILFANNRVGWRVAEQIAEAGDSIVGLVLHPPERRKFASEIVRSARAAGVADEAIFDATRLGEPDTIDALRALRAEIGVSALFGYILRRELLQLFPGGCINVHPALLPYNRGAYPNVWSIVDGTPAGVTVHYVDEGVDTGDIVAQRSVEAEPVDTGATLYARLERECIALFRDAWPAIRSGSAERTPQPSTGGTTHRTRDVQCIDEIDLDRTYTARELLNVLRARTFPPFRGAYFLEGGRRVYLELGLRYDD